MLVLVLMRMHTFLGDADGESIVILKAPPGR